MGVAEIVGIILSIVQAAKEAQEKADFSNWQEEVTYKLSL